MCFFVAWNLVLHYYIWLEECVTVCFSPQKSLSHKTMPMLTVLLCRVAVSQQENLIATYQTVSGWGI